MNIFKRFLNLLNYSSLSHRRYKNDYLFRAISELTAGILLIGLAVSNFVSEYFVSGLLCVGIAILTFAAAYIVWFKKGITASNSIMIVVNVMFSIVMVIGCNEGFMVIWSLFVPILTMSVFGVKYGFWCSLYYLIYLNVLFYTPLVALVRKFYSDTFIYRFPILYFCNFLITALIVIQWQNMLVKQSEKALSLERSIKTEREKVTNVSMQTILSISNAVDAKDKYTRQHSQRVADYSIMIASKLGGWSRERIQQLHQIALVHDIGKIGVPDSILHKPGKLTDEEYEQMKMHTVLGGEILKDLSLIPNVALGAKYHHERYDGKGYPKGLKGTEIPIEARIIGIADAFDAMNSNRVYRDKRSGPYIYNELVKGRGTQFDPDILDVFLPIARELLQTPYKTV